MKKNPHFVLSLCFLVFALTKPAFCGETITDKEKLKSEMTGQDLNMRDGADTFWSGVIVGGVSAATLIPVSMAVNMDSDKKRTVFGIAGAVMGAITLGLMAWGGIEWLAASGRMDELKKMEKDLTLVPCMSPATGNTAAIGFMINNKI